MIPVTLILDENLSFRLKKPLETIFRSVFHVSDLGLAAGDDGDIWTRAAEMEAVILTKDDDFNVRALLEGPPPKILHLRTGNSRNPDVIEAIQCQSEFIREFIVNPEAAILTLR